MAALKEEDLLRASLNKQLQAIETNHVLIIIKHIRHTVYLKLYMIKGSSMQKQMYTLKEKAHSVPYAMLILIFLECSTAVS